MSKTLTGSVIKLSLSEKKLIIEALNIIYNKYKLVSGILSDDQLQQAAKLQKLIKKIETE